jgi:plastocyanin
VNIDFIVREFRHGALAAGLLVAFIAPGPLDAESTGTVTGIVTTKASGLKPVGVTIDQNVCGNELPDEAIVTNAAGRLANAVVTVVGVKARARASSSSVINEKCRFSPRVQIVSPNATITTSSSDPILHTTNAQTNAGKTIFNVAVPVPGIKITKPVKDVGLLRLSCNTHPWMRGWVLVTDEMSRVSGSDGTFTLNDVPAGTYELRVWHEALKGSPQKITVAPGKTTSVSFLLQ